MQYTELGQTGMRVSTLALGCWPFAGGQVWGRQHKSDSIATVHAALDAGINFFDTAIAYENGESERVLGEALRKRRAEAVIATKLGGAQTHPDRIRDTCIASLRNLQTDCIDLYQIHWPAWDIPVEDTVGGLQELRTLGWIRHFSVCNYGPRDFADLSRLVHVPSNQVPYSLLWRVVEREILPLCRQTGTGLICYSPLMQGLLAGRYRSADEVPAGLARTRLYSHARPGAEHSEAGCEELVFAALSDIGEIAHQLGHEMASLALAWVRQQPGVASLLVGARKPQELQRNLPALAIALPDDVLVELDRVTAPILDYLGHNPDMWQTQSRIR